jgi:hypothetical protein
MAVVPLRSPVLSQNLGSFIRVQLVNPGAVRSFKTSSFLQTGERQFIRRAKERMGIKERAMQPAGGTAFGIGETGDMRHELT